MTHVTVMTEQIEIEREVQERTFTERWREREEKYQAWLQRWVIEPYNRAVGYDPSIDSDDNRWAHGRVERHHWGYWSVRAWFHCGHQPDRGQKWRREREVSLELAIGTEDRSPSASVCWNPNGDTELLFHLRLWPFPVGVYVGLQGFLKAFDFKGDYLGREREIRFCFWDDGSLSWSLWAPRDDISDWSRKAKGAKWRRSNFNLVDFLLGRKAYSEVVGSPEPVRLTLPEGTYVGTFTPKNCTWKRPRWFWPSHRMKRGDFSTIVNIPEPGKGENSRDLGDTWGNHLSGPYMTAAQAAEALGKMILKTRLDRGGRDWVPSAGWPPAQEGFTPQVRLI